MSILYVLCFFFQAIEYYDAKADSDYVSGISVLCFENICFMMINVKCVNLQDVKTLQSELSQYMDCLSLTSWEPWSCNIQYL